MKSPFPGMNPYIESAGLWEDFHNHLIDAVYRTIAPNLPRGYTASTAARTYFLMGAEGKVEHLAKPDVSVTAPAEFAGSVLMQAFVAEKFRETFVEIYLEGEERSLITCIEVLSPSNKRRGTEGRREYERKRQAMLLGQANFLELDLLRGGQKLPMRSQWPDSPYTLLVSWARDAPYCRVWPGHFKTRLPVIPVPLLDPEPDLSLDLQPLLDDIYALGRYDELLDYGRPLQPTLPNAEAEWVREQLRRRPKG